MKGIKKTIQNQAAQKEKKETLLTRPKDLVNTISTSPSANS